MTIDAFRGKWTKLGNYSSCVVFFDGHAYQSTEHAYQAQKSTDPAIQKMIRDCPTPAVAKKLARSVRLRDDWDQVKVSIMLELLREKFSQEPERSILMSTGDQELIEGGWWHDQFWGNCTCENHKDIPGSNMLGKLLMSVRKELREVLPEQLSYESFWEAVDNELDKFAKSGEDISVLRKRYLESLDQ